MHRKLFLSLVFSAHLSRNNHYWIWLQEYCCIVYQFDTFVHTRYLIWIANLPCIPFLVVHWEATGSFLPWLKYDQPCPFDLRCFDTNDGEHLINLFFKVPLHLGIVEKGELSWSPIILVELILGLQRLNLTEDPVPHAFKLFIHAFEFVATCPVIVSNRQLFSLFGFRILLRFFHVVVGIHFSFRRSAAF